MDGWMVAETKRRRDSRIDGVTGTIRSDRQNNISKDTSTHSKGDKNKPEVQPKLLPEVQPEALTFPENRTTQ